MKIIILLPLIILLIGCSNITWEEPIIKPTITLVNDTIRNKLTMEELVNECGEYCEQTPNYKVGYNKVNKTIDCHC